MNIILLLVASVVALVFAITVLDQFLLELLGIIIIFIGFLRRREVFGFYRIPLIHDFSRVSGD